MVELLQRLLRDRDDERNGQNTNLLFDSHCLNNSGQLFQWVSKLLFIKVSIEASMKDFY